MAKFELKIIKNNSLAWILLKKEDANYTAAEFVESVARLKGDVSLQIQAVREIETDELQETPPITALGRYHSFRRKNKTLLYHSNFKVNPLV